MNAADISILIAFFAGVLSFFSPCILPLIPSYLCYITGFSVDDLASGDIKRVVKDSFIGSVFFVLGFSLLFIALGVGVSFLGKIFIPIANLLRIVGGFVIIFFGLVIAGFFKIRFLQIEKRLTIKNKPLGYFGAFLVGMAFSVGWTPCVGPIISSILIVAGTGQSVVKGFLLLTAYSLGLGLPIIASAIAFDYLLTFFRKIRNYMNLISIISGSLLIILGILVVTDNFSYLMQVIAVFFNFKGI